MSRRTFAILFFAAIISFPLFGADYAITPATGPTSGGTEVTITGDFSSFFAYGVLFGGIPAQTRFVDRHTLVATTPAHLPGTVAVTIFEYDLFLFTGLSFTFTGDVPAQLERVLLPIFIDPVHGQFGSEFVTSFNAQLQRGEQATIHGLSFPCRIICPPLSLPDSPLLLLPNAPRIYDRDVDHSGNPGRFIYMPKSEVTNVAMNLRVFDRSRATQNYGTEIPVVRESHFTEGFTSLTLLSVPTDPKFRNTLRIYGTGPHYVGVRIEGEGFAPIDHDILVSGGDDLFHPAMATFTDFPSNVGPVTVTIDIPAPPITPLPPPRMWAMVTVTNNETQLITTITPQP